MQAAVRIRAKVLPGNRIEIEVPDSSVGAEGEVMVVFPETIPIGFDQRDRSYHLFLIFRRERRTHEICGFYSKCFGENQCF
ncbi:hypothetical protein [Leptolyngbya sp. GGD]|uniref:hypothetical protein n=1 Tax=Leptolyngbya sp. GGD TaxID=2997907 RepID=UPI00227B82EA|nr:hypothetical protein [Leptolyngbya sp. GGD]MCY6492997.1 hypothetical protein [Leptolyngbya sp. GGD]